MQCDSEARIRLLRAALLRIADDASVGAPENVRNIAVAALRTDAGGVIAHAIGIPSFWWQETLCGSGIERNSTDTAWAWARGHRGVDWRRRRSEINCPDCLRDLRLRFDGTPIDELGPLSTRVANSLSHETILSIEYVESITDRELLRLPNVGKKSVAELRHAVAAWRARRQACPEMMLGG